VEKFQKDEHNHGRAYRGGLYLSASSMN